MTVRIGDARGDRDAGALRWAWIVEENGGSSALSREEFITGFVEQARMHSATHQCFVAEAGGAVVGMAWLAREARVPSPRFFERHGGDLQCVHVLPDFRGRGIGAKLIEAVVDAADEGGAERLTVHSSPGAVSAQARAGLEASEMFRSRVLRRVG